MTLPQYVLLDGDQVGQRIEDLLLRDALPRLYFLVQDLNEAILVLDRLFRGTGGQVYLTGGDSVLGSVANVPVFLQRLRSLRRTLPFTFSTGIGRSPRTAHIALRLAKARGPGSIVRIRERRGLYRFAHWDEVEGWKEERPAGRAAPRRRPKSPPRRPRDRGLRGISLRGRRGSPPPSG